LNDRQHVPGVGTVNYPYNREITTIRGIMPGEYVFNVHLYRKENESKPIPVTVILEKLNPQVKLLYSKVVTLSHFWEEKTIIRFVLNVDGEIEESFFIYKPLVENIIGRREASHSTGLSGQRPSSANGQNNSLFSNVPQRPKNRDEE